MKQAWMKTLALGTCAWLLSATAMAFQGPHRVIDWALMLDLSEQQEQQLSDIENQYRKRIDALYEQAGPGAWGKVASDEEVLKQRQQLRAVQAEQRAAMIAVLTTEQRQKGAEAVRRFHIKMTRGLIQRMTANLTLTEAQKKALDDGVLRVTADHEWPLDHEQNEIARARMEALLSENLTPEQLKQVQDERAEQMKRWPRLPKDMEGPGGMPPMLPPPPEFGGPRGDMPSCPDNGPGCDDGPHGPDDGNFPDAGR
ncbi:hypothetical protein [Parathalassolituus penaei]|uniref:Periplasmic heavy metal sensor n=1 Tax=Parathalassolituus penaei TaxID=2997323 RepID=A0A9X3ECF1_9GAMM|nr:hypothetical protein [Parathalassolituus penaei]MCY0964982.1 hypothetical protein [Parathalassolituus penaei]